MYNSTSRIPVHYAGRDRSKASPVHIASSHQQPKNLTKKLGREHIGIQQGCWREGGKEGRGEGKREEGEEWKVEREKEGWREGEVKGERKRGERDGSRGGRRREGE